MPTPQKNTTKDGSPKKKNWILWSLGIIGTGILSFFGYQYYQSNKTTDLENKDLPDPGAEQDPPRKDPGAPPPKAKPKPAATVKPKPSHDAFPLRKGSKGPRVKAMQEAILAKFGKALLPRYGADGHYGEETQKALAQLQLPLAVDEPTFNVLVKTSALNPTAIAQGLLQAAVKKDFQAAVNHLRLLKSPEDYKSVSEVFKTYRIEGGVRQTLVNGMLNTFTLAPQKEALKLLFSAMGLKYNGQQWSLSGFARDGLLITTRDTRVWKSPRESVSVPKNMLLGKAIQTRKGFTLFENENTYYLVPTLHVRAYT